MVRPLKHLKIQNLQDVIKETAWKQIAEQGAAALSLRAIARSLEITAPAIYNYFPDRDALVTALIVDAYTSLGDSQIAARDGLPTQDLAGRLKATGRAYRQWALSHPQHYQLIFGTPIPGYQSPIEKVLPAGTRSLGALVSVVDAIHIAGRLNVSGIPTIMSQFRPVLNIWMSYLQFADESVLSVSMLIWARVHGIVSLEISNSLPLFGEDGSALYEFEMKTIEQQFIKE